MPWVGRLMDKKRRLRIMNEEARNRTIVGSDITRQEKKMAYEQRVGSTNLFRNRDKEKNPKAPDFKGTVEVQVGELIVEIDLGLWQRHSEKAGDYLGMAAKAKGSRPVDDVERAMPSESEDIPF